MGPEQLSLVLTLLDNMGRVVYTGQAMTNERVQFSEKLTAGVYHWRVKSVRGDFQLSWVIQ
jgi:hypothetical protein